MTRVNTAIRYVVEMDCTGSCFDRKRVCKKIAKVYRRMFAGESPSEKDRRRKSTREGPPEKVHRIRSVGEGLREKVRQRRLARKKGH